LDTRIPLRNTVYGVAANLLLVPLLVLPFGRANADGIIGVAAAYSLAQYVNVAHAWYRLRRDLQIRSDGLSAFVWRLVIGTLAMTAVLVAGYVALDLGAPQARWRLLALTSAVALAGLAALAITLKAIGGGEFADLTRSFRRRPPGPPTTDPGLEAGSQPAATGSGAWDSRT
jgi:peptidoglycan biosynthesis protein MviN/MurJ (putative lipid II flippase)